MANQDSERQIIEILSTYKTSRNMCDKSPTAWGCLVSDLIVHAAIKKLMEE